MHKGFRRIGAAALTMVAALALSGCGSSSTGADPAKAHDVTILTHDDFKLPDELIQKFESDSGLKLHVEHVGSGATLVNKLNLTKDAPLGDLVFGLATNDMGLVKKDDLLANPGSIDYPASAQELLEPLTPYAFPVDRSDLCVNYDVKYFADHNLPEPKTFEDLTKPEYKGLFVAIDPVKVTGFGFLAATISHFGEDGWQQYWKDLKANDVKIAPGWTEAYNQDFTQGEGHGRYPIVLSYASSPSFTVSEDGQSSSTKSMEATCYRQVEYAGVLKNATNPEGAAKVLRWLMSPEVQAAIPDSMYMYPVDTSVKLPDSYKFAPQPKNALVLPADQVAQKSEEWRKTWLEIMGG